MKHIFKPKYKICFQTRNKVWIYKNSRLRYFHRVRHKIVLKTGRFFKRYLITKNMKWTVARRQMVPYLRRKNRFTYNYKNMFFTKQQLKHFYGDLKEYEMRNIFKRSWNVTKMFRCNTFLGALEQRLSMILFRMRFLPTIFSCHQYIKHKGILINEALINHPNCCVVIGDIVTIPKDQWFIFYEFLYDRLENRMFGASVCLWRKDFFMKRLIFLRYRNKHKFIKNFKLLKTFKKLKLKFKYIKKHVFKIFKILYKKKVGLLKNKNLQVWHHLSIERINLKLKYLKILNKSLYVNIFFSLKKIQRRLKKLAFLRSWSHPLYLITVNKIVIRIFNVKNLIVNFSLVLYKILAEWEISSRQFLYLPKDYDSEDFDAILKLDYKERTLFLKKRNSHLLLNKSLKQYLSMRLKKKSFLRAHVTTYRRHVNYKLRKLRFKRGKKRIFKQWCRKPHLFIPHYFEVDFNTLRTCFIKHPEIKEVFYGFRNTFKKIISFYKERAL